MSKTHVRLVSYRTLLCAGISALAAARRGAHAHCAGPAVASSTSMGAVAVGANTDDPAFCGAVKLCIGGSTL